jgi:hypothetical protein
MIRELVNIVMEIPLRNGLEMGHYFGLFMAGIATFNDKTVEESICQKLKADERIGVYVSLLARSRESMLTIYSALRQR